MDNSNLWQSQPKPVKKQAPPTESILEALKGVGGGVTKTVTKDVVGKVGSDVLTSLFGQTPRSSELFRSQEVPQAEVQRVRIQSPETIRPQLVKQEEASVKQQIESVRQELKRLVASLKSLNQEVQKAVSEVPVHPGIYHLNFVERLRSILKILREQIDDSRSWLALSTNRKKKKGYWSMFKKHGTSFGLSGERTIATQAG